MVIGIDVGISTTKIVGIKDSKVISPLRIKATDPVTSLYGAFGKFLHSNNLNLKDIKHVVLTGVGSDYVNEPIYGLPTSKTEEFICNGVGARYLSGKERIIVVSMGTGTSLVRCDCGKIEHIGGIGLGGGTLQGLSLLLLKTDDIHQIVELAQKGDLKNINVLIGDISAHPLPNLPMDAVASLFGNAKGDASNEDIARGIIWMVLQTAGLSAVLASTGSNIREYVMIGNLSRIPLCNEIFPSIEDLYKVKLIIPKYSEYCTAIGAALCHFDDRYEKTPV